MPGVCATCAKPAATRLCGRCKVTHYCSPECQSQHWQVHKPKCTPPVSKESASSKEGDKKSNKKIAATNAEKEFGCTHYKRKCALVSPCCGRVFSCRFCHDAEMYENETDEKKCHKLNRHAVTHIVCLSCGRKQRASPFCGGDTCTQMGNEKNSVCNKNEPTSASVASCTDATSSSLPPSPSLASNSTSSISASTSLPSSSSSSSSSPSSPSSSASSSLSSSSNQDKGCGERFAVYCCLICNLFDEEGDKKKIFHCEACGICRVGGRDAFFHCARCNACYSKELSTHACVEQSLQRNCPVCQEDMFTSRINAQVLPCGHTMHSPCLKEFLKAGSYKCPTCNRTVLEATGARGLWARMKAEVDSTPMPTEYASQMVQILCNDCNLKSSVPFHIIGYECSHCHSFNTVRE